jgi:hypothetical protein
MTSVERNLGKELRGYVPTQLAERAEFVLKIQVCIVLQLPADLLLRWGTPNGPPIQRQEPGSHHGVSS